MTSFNPVGEKQSAENNTGDIRNDEKVKRALSENLITVPRDQSELLKEGKRFCLGCVIVFVSSIALYFLLGWERIPVPELFLPFAKKAVVAALMISSVLLFARLVKNIFDRRIEDKTTVFNFNRVADLIVALFILIIVLTILFANWYATMVSFGIVSLILGFAMQNPITSFFGWLYILIRKPYEVGDRIRIGNVYGDIINVGYMDTTLWEFRGDYLTGDHPSGRIIRFANSKVFNEYVYNYSWPLFPFIWNELILFISYDSDLKFTQDTIVRVVEVEIGEAMMQRVKRFKEILKETPVDALDVDEFPSVILRAHSNGWLEVVVRYVVDPKNSGRVKKRLFEIVMDELKKYPDKIGFPNKAMKD